jgi:uncharacterized protein
VTQKPPQDCVRCGCCCINSAASAIRVTGDDYSRLSEHAESLVQFIGNRAFMKLKDGHCTALKIDVTCARLTCTIYERRPQVCRDLAEGSPECNAERHHKAARRLKLLNQRASLEP